MPIGLLNSFFLSLEKTYLMFLELLQVNPVVFGASKAFALTCYKETMTMISK